MTLVEPSWVHDHPSDFERRRGQRLFQRIHEIDQISCAALRFAQLATLAPSSFTSYKDLNDALEENIFAMKEAEIYLSRSVRECVKNLLRSDTLPTHQEAKIAYQHDWENAQVIIKITNLPLEKVDIIKTIDIPPAHNVISERAKQYAAVEVAYNVPAWD